MIFDLRPVTLVPFNCNFEVLKKTGTSKLLPYSYLGTFKRKLFVKISCQEKKWVSFYNEILVRNFWRKLVECVGFVFRSSCLQSLCCHHFRILCVSDKIPFNIFLYREMLSGQPLKCLGIIFHIGQFKVFMKRNFLPQFFIVLERWVKIII